ncbi:hypothetical protein [Mycolicibacterium gilvum]|uniref:Uncharacterized protein n=1 Tax=Mycolicibacterium gilvum (strain DSM 45189 / LMG 24558 / Spyr1) TaxID=278137 RepID=E6TMT2_MYCSR|nr:hypothetical protein [Mycolicibacterium gilvum]ADT97178.1 hypothetical protein Mspyr1_04670 [Mycolicibacterium gilvum Spyr1]
MARVAAAPAAQHAGLYEWLRDREEARLARWARNDGTAFPYPKHRIEAFREGRPVEVPGWMLPRQVRQSSEYLKHHRRVSPSGVTVWIAQTARVFPDNRVVYRARTARELLDDDGMLNGEDAHPQWGNYLRTLTPSDD